VDEWTRLQKRWTGTDAEREVGCSGSLPSAREGKAENGTHQVMTRCSYGEVKYSKVPFSLDGTCFGAAPRLFEVRM
jgi:hypothetical protein